MFRRAPYLLSRGIPPVRPGSATFSTQFKKPGVLQFLDQLKNQPRIQSSFDQTINDLADGAKVFVNALHDETIDRDEVLSDLAKNLDAFSKKVNETTVSHLVKGLTSTIEELDKSSSLAYRPRQVTSSAELTGNITITVTVKDDIFISILTTLSYGKNQRLRVRLRSRNHVD